MPLWSVAQRPKCLNEAIRRKQKAVIHDAAIGRDDDEPGRSAGAICPHDGGHGVCRGRICDCMSKGNTQPVSSLICPQAIEGVDFGTFEHSLDGRQADILISKFLGEGHEGGKAMSVAARTPILKEVQYLKALPQFGQGQGATRIAIFIDPPDMFKLGRRQPYNSRPHEILQ